MTAFRHTHVSGEDWRHMLNQATAELRGAPGHLGFVYLTEPLSPHLDEVLDALRLATKVEHWVGAVAGGICATGVESYDRPALAAMVADLPEESFRVFPPITHDLKTFDAAQQAWLGNHLPYIALVHADPGNKQTRELIEQLAARTATGFLVGGLSSAAVGQEARLIANESCGGGLSGVVLSDAVAVQTGLSQGCSPIGPQRRITEAQRNVIMQLDGRPALDVLKSDIGPELARDLSQIGGRVFAGLPIRGSDTGDYLVRNLVGIDSSKRLLAIAELVEAGQNLMFCRRDANSAREDLARMLRHLKSRLKQPPRGGIYVSCLGRGANLFGEDSDELRLIRDQLGDFPLVGFFANGEIFQDRLYGYTGVLTVFP
ncbi:FIST signal transduction protein [Rhabdochromatium marinum]|uniref:FIST signal transduction protein n=1 Tax=Rhabdochromatium marinum TaxID=48729 RepID=UPI001904A428|nr:FIST N-terminal domain-containing protein [Rhabdochromatium marinum]MBK1647171.1 histidine kinase [Rhabdochromatium marinum]